MPYRKKLGGMHWTFPRFSPPDRSELPTPETAISGYRDNLCCGLYMFNSTGGNLLEHPWRTVTHRGRKYSFFLTLKLFFLFFFFSTKLKVFYLPRALSVHRLLTGLRTALHFFSSFLHQLQCMEEQRILLLKRAGNQITAPKLRWYGYDGVKERQNLINKQEKVNFWEKHFFIVFEPPISPLQMSYGR